MDKARVELMLSLARRKREEGISDEEQLELDALRQEYLSDFRDGFKQQLDMVYLQQEDGSYQKLQKKPLTPDDKGDC